MSIVTLPEQRKFTVSIVVENVDGSELTRDQVVAAVQKWQIASPAGIPSTVRLASVTDNSPAVQVDGTKLTREEFTAACKRHGKAMGSMQYYTDSEIEKGIADPSKIVAYIDSRTDQLNAYIRHEQS